MGLYTIRSEILLCWTVIFLFCRTFSFGLTMVVQALFRSSSAVCFAGALFESDFCAISFVALCAQGRAANRFCLVQSRGLACIMLRRALLADYAQSDEQSVEAATSVRDIQRIWGFLSTDTRTIIKTELFNALQQEEQHAVRIKLNDTIADLGAIIWKQGEWPDLLENLNKFTSSTLSPHRESALTIFGQLVLMGYKAMEPYHADIRNLIELGLNDSTNVRVRMSAMKAASSFIAHGLKGPIRRSFQALIPNTFALLQDCLNHNLNEGVSVLELMCEWADHDAKFFDQHIGVIVNGCLGLAGNNQGKEDVRQTALELLITLSEKQPAMLREVPNFVNNMFAVMIGMLLEVEDMNMAEWNEEDDSEERTEWSNVDVAEHAIDRFCKKIGVKQLFSTVLRDKMFTMINTGADWKHRFVGLQLIALIGEGCGKQMKKYLNDLVAALLPRFADPHPRVRWAACNTGGQLAIDFAPAFQDKYHQHILPSVKALLADTQNPKVQSHAAAAITTFCGKYGNDEDETKIEEYLSPFIDDILRHLYDMLSSPNRFAIEEAVTCVAALATVAPGSFGKYYSFFMPALKTMLGSVIRTTEYTILRSKCVECISLIGVAVGPETFLPDAEEFLTLLTQNFDYFTADANREFLMQASTRLCKCLRERFLPYLSVFMPFLLKHAGMTKKDFMTYSIHDGNDVAEEAGWEFYVVRDKKVGIHQAALDEKLSACTQLHLYVEYLGDLLFNDWMQALAQLFVPLMSFAFHKSIRATALATIPLLLNSTKSFCEKSGRPITVFNELFQYCWTNLVEAYKEETQYDLQAIGIEAIHECIDICPANTLPLDYARDAFDLLPATLNAIEDTVKARAERREMGDADETDEAEFAEEEVHEHDVTVEFVEVICSLMKNHKPQFMQLFPTYLPLVMRLASETDRRDAERQLGLCIVCDLVEHTAEAVHPMGPTLIPLLIQQIESTHFGIRQACGYGLGLWSQFAPQILAPFASQALLAVGKVITAEAREDDDLCNPTENCISAFGKLLRNMAQWLEPAAQKEGVAFWVNQLPLVSDTVEAPPCHEVLVDLIQQYAL